MAEVNIHTHIPTKYGHATYTGEPSPELHKAVEKMADIAYNNADVLADVQHQMDVILSFDRFNIDVVKSDFQLAPISTMADYIAREQVRCQDSCLRQFFEKYCEKLPCHLSEGWLQRKGYTMVKDQDVYWFEKNGVRWSPKFIWEKEEKNENGAFFISIRLKIIEA